MVKRGEIKLFKDNKSNNNNNNNNNGNNNNYVPKYFNNQGSNNHNDKSKSWNKNNNKNLVNDGVVESHNLKSTPFIIPYGANSSNNVNQAIKAPYNSNNSNNNSNTSNNKTWDKSKSNSNYNKMKFTYLGEPLENVLRTLLVGQVITLPEISSYEL